LGRYPPSSLLAFYCRLLQSVAIRASGADNGHGLPIVAQGDFSTGSSSRPKGSRRSPRDRMAAAAGRVEPVAAAFAVTLREPEFRAAP
jgi:hypothetical protein